MKDDPLLQGGAPAPQPPPDAFTLQPGQYASAPDAFTLPPDAAAAPAPVAGGSTYSIRVPAVAVEDSSIWLGAAGGLGAAIVGGAVWGIVAAKTGYEAGYVAIGVGLLSALAVTRLGRGSGNAFTAVAVGAALLGILIGKYCVFVHFWNEAAGQFAELAGGEARLTALGFPEPLHLGYVSSESVSQFREHHDLVFGIHDVLWIGLAALGAAQLSRARN